MSSKIPRANLPVEAKKNDNKLESRDTASAPTGGVRKADTKENIPRKNVVPKVPKGVSTRFGQQAELKEQNQCLTAANAELQKNLSESQQKAAELEVQFSELIKEKAEVQKNLQDCHALLVAAKIDPVLGGKVGEAARENGNQQKEVMSVSQDLLKELHAFSSNASQQHVCLDEIQTTISDLTEAREHMVQERVNFTRLAAELEDALKEAESLLL